jgi:hypothetical protein
MFHLSPAIGFTRNEFDTAGRAASVAATGVHHIHTSILLNSKD